MPPCSHFHFALEGFEKRTGSEVLAIPHNGNLSNGLMFANIDFNGKELTRKYAEARMRWEPSAMDEARPSKPASRPAAGSA